MVRRLFVVASLGALLAHAGCASSLGSPDDPDIERSDGYLSFEEFVAQATFDDEHGIWIVDGDTPVHTWKELHEIYQQIDQPGRLILDRSGGRDAVWDATQRMDLTYCVSTRFGSRHAQVVAGMRDAAAAWEAVANVRFRHVAAEDARCTSSNSAVLFDVNPTSGSGYLARAFFPGNPRSWRNVIIDSSCWYTSAPLTCTGVLRHELGHVLGFRHEHTRPEAGRCFEDNAWRPLTSYDRTSVMHYPQCGGRNPTLDLSAQDIAGVRAVYGAASGGGEPPPPLPGADRTDDRTGSGARGAWQQYAPYDVVPGSTFRAITSGMGDADLYVRVGSQPSDAAYDCRSISETADETCEITVPAGATRVFVGVLAYTDASWSLRVSYRTTGATPPPPDPGVPPPAIGTERRGRASGSLRRGAMQNYAALPVVAGSTFTVDTTGTGDPDLYVRWNEAATVERADCRSATRGSAIERCSITVPATATSARLMVHAWSDTTFSLSAQYVAP